MKKSGILLPIAIAAAMAATLTSCGDYVGKEKTHPLFIKAGTAKNAGNYQDAAKFWEEFLTICPKSAETHFRLASVYGDNLDDPLKAVYHYRKYLELAPNDTANAEDINSFTELARKRLYEKLREEYKDTSAAVALNEDLEKTQKRLAQYVEYAKALENQNQLMKQRLRAIAEARKAQAAPNSGSAAASAAAPAATVPAAKAVPANSAGKSSAAQESAGKTGTYKVQPGDTLLKISRKLYGSQKYYKLIADANKDVLSANMGVRAGQTLKIPPLPSKTDKSVHP